MLAINSTTMKKSFYLIVMLFFLTMFTLEWVNHLANKTFYPEIPFAPSWPFWIALYLFLSTLSNKKMVKVIHLAIIIFFLFLFFKKTVEHFTSDTFEAHLPVFPGWPFWISFFLYLRIPWQKKTKKRR